MKSITSCSITMSLLLCLSCGSKEKKENPTNLDKKESSAAKTVKGNEIDLKQNGDYTELYAKSENCKLTSAQFAEALGIMESQVIPNNSYGGSCWFKFSGSENLETNYGVSLEKFPNSVVMQEIKNAQKEESIDIQLSETGDTYITRHPVQGFLLILNPNYSNAVRVSYNYFNPNGPKLTREQQEERKQNTYKIANYLIDQYKK